MLWDCFTATKGGPSAGPPLVEQQLLPDYCSCEDSAFLMTPRERQRCDKQEVWPMKLSRASVCDIIWARTFLRAEIELFLSTSISSVTLKAHAEKEHPPVLSTIK